MLHAREEWPEPWRLCLRQVDAILALPECIVVEAPEEGAVEQHLQSAIAALGATDSTGWSRALGALQKLDRLTLVAALSGLPARVGLAEALAADAKGVA